ncbi:MAG: hypothetical protein WC420_03895, partial [Candidatus Paceibacterota bacterium]
SWNLNFAGIYTPLPIKALPCWPVANSFPHIGQYFILNVAIVLLFSKITMPLSFPFPNKLSVIFLSRK